MKLWINILSGNDGLVAQQLGRLSKSESVPVFSTIEKRVVGRTLTYEVRNEIDLWAEVEVEETAQPFERAAGLMVQQEDGLKLLGVLGTNLSREEIRSLV
jgi:hypothetical protein